MVFIPQGIHCLFLTSPSFSHLFPPTPPLQNPHWAEAACEETEPVRFCDLDLSSYDSDADADYVPSELGEATEEELEWYSDASEEESEGESDN